MANAPLKWNNPPLGLGLVLVFSGLAGSLAGWNQSFALPSMMRIAISILAFSVSAIRLVIAFQAAIAMGKPQPARVTIKRPMWIALGLLMVANLVAQTASVLSLPLDTFSTNALQVLRLTLVPGFLVLALLMLLRAIRSPS